MGIVLQQPSPADRVNAGPSFYTQPKTQEGGFWDSAAASYVNENSIASWIADMEYQNIEDIVTKDYDQYQDVPEDLSDMSMNVWQEKPVFVTKILICAGSLLWWLRFIEF